MFFPSWNSVSACREINIDGFEGRTDMHDGANLIFVSRGYRPEGRNVGYLLAGLRTFLTCNGYGRMRSRGQEYN